MQHQLRGRRADVLAAHAVEALRDDDEGLHESDADKSAAAAAAERESFDVHREGGAGGEAATAAHHGSVSSAILDGRQRADPKAENHHQEGAGEGQRGAGERQRLQLVVILQLILQRQQLIVFFLLRLQRRTRQ